MSAARDLIDTLDDTHRATALQVLDTLTRPMTPREIEGALRHAGVSRSRAVKLASTLKHFSIVAVMGPEGGERG